MNHKSSVTVPGKTLLFGEYGLLTGGEGVVVTLPSFRFHIGMELKEKNGHAENCLLSIRSDFFETGQKSFLLGSLPGAGDADANFWQGLLFPYLDFLNGFETFEIEIKESFSPSLGFGSSSALVAAVHSFLYRAEFGRDTECLAAPVFWERVFIALEKMQSRGSGYDVATQHAASYSGHVQFWNYKKGNETVPSLIELEMPRDVLNFGLLVATGNYASTKLAVQKFLADEDKKRAAAAHSELAKDFLGNLAAHVLPQLMRRSRAIAREQGILSMPEGQAAQLVEALENKGLHFKTLGSGFGDCLWVACEKEEFLEAARTSGMSDDAARASVVFNFAEVSQVE